MITILMATYNGEKYIKEQIDSLLSQTEQRFTIVISDDGSTDSTIEIISDYVKKYPEKIKLINNDQQQGAKYNFLNLMIKNKDDYIMLCDQDDVWLSKKIEISLEAIQKLESTYGTNMPLLVHTDLKVVDQKLNLIFDSYKDMINVNYARVELKDQIIQNTLTGCTAMYNRTLADLINKQPKFFVIHDWWLILLASAFGKIAPIDERDILYRQHDDNVIGAKRVKSFKYIFDQIFLNASGIIKSINDTYLQAQSFLDMYGDRLNEEQRKLLMDYIKIPKHGKIKRIIELQRLGVMKNGFIRQIAQLLFV